jgi:hypothetical protein
MRFFRGYSRASLSIAAFIALPLFFASLMASTLALEKPYKIEWMRAGNIVATWHDPSTATVTRIWLWAFVPPLVLTVVGLLAMRLPFGFYVSCAAGIVIAMAVVHKASTWQAHHTARYPNGVDLIPAGIKYAASNKYDPGQWETMAHETAVSLEHWTIGVSLASAVVMGALWVRRRFFARRPVSMTPLEGIHAPDATSPGLDSG